MYWWYALIPQRIGYFEGFALGAHGAGKRYSYKSQMPHNNKSYVEFSYLITKKT